MPAPLPVAIVDAFATRPFEGNPAAVVLVPPDTDAAVGDGWRHAVAAEMNLSETAFVSPRGPSTYALRWFTPTVEVDLCGHATLAAAHLLVERGDAVEGAPLTFTTRSGPLTATAHGGRVEIDLPIDDPVAGPPPAGLLSALGLRDDEVEATARGRYDLLVVTTADRVRRLDPDHRALRRVDTRAVIVAATGDDGRHDVISRVFAPGSGIDEDPVTGSAHCTLAAWFAPELGGALLARQVSRRGGTLDVRIDGDRVRLGGRAVTVLRGEIGHPS